MSLNETITNLGDSIINLVDKKRHGTLGLEQGDVGYDKEVWSDINKYKHSTFDKSKFTVVGSPIISDDGVVSKFNGSRLNTIKVNQISANSFTIKAKFKLTSLTQGVIFSSRLDGTTEFGLSVIYDKGRIMVFASSNGTSWDIVHTKTGTTLLQTETDYLITVSFNGVTYLVELENLITNTKTTEITVNSTSKIYSGNNYIALGSSLGWNTLDGQIDLKHFSITVDGKEVFNGNKTGLDVIKEDNYTVVGSPVISEDGIASGFSTSNYIKKVLETPLTQDNDLDLETSFTTGSELSEQKIVSFNGEYLTVPRLEMGSDGSIIFVYKNNSGQEQYLNLGKTAINTKYAIKIINKAGTFIVLWNGVEKLRTTDFIYTISGFYTKFVAKSFTGSIDLNAFKIYVDGKLVYQPCLKIPYTESKTGSKIVNEFYRGRVVDMYEQEGQAGYYTIQEGKKDNYNVIGSPTITNDGIASGFSNARLNTIKVSQISANSFTIKMKFKLTDLTQGVLFSSRLGIGLNSEYGLSVIYNKGKILVFASSNGTTWDIMSAKTGITSLEINTDYIITVSFNGTTYLVELENLITNVKTTEITVNSTSKIYSGNNYIAMGANLGWETMQGSIDLNAFKIYINGELAYQAIIPPNYTLPQGDVYGVLSTKSNSSEIAHYAMPSEVYADLTIGASGSTYTAPADGYFVVQLKAEAAGEYVVFKVTKDNIDYLNSTDISASNNQYLRAWLPIKKGENATLFYTATGTDTYTHFRFIYAEGSKGEKQ